MLQKPCKTLGFKKKYILQNSVGEGKPYPASGLIYKLMKYKIEKNKTRKKQTKYGVRTRNLQDSGQAINPLCYACFLRVTF